MNAAHEGRFVKATIGRRAHFARPEDDTRITGPRNDADREWRRAVRGGQKGYAKGGLFASDDGVIVGGDGVRATRLSDGAAGFARLLPPAAKQPAGPLAPGLRYVFTPSTGEPPVVLYDFALRLAESRQEREVRIEVRQADRRRAARKARRAA